MEGWRGGRIDRLSFIALYYTTEHKGHQSWRPSHSGVHSDIHKVKLLQLICSTSLVEPMGKRNGECRVLMGIPQVKSPLKRHKLRWEENIKMFLQVSERMDLAQDRENWWALSNTVRNLRVPESTANFLNN